MARLTPIFALLVPTLLIFVLPALELLQRNPDYFAGELRNARPVLLMALVTFALSGALWWLRHRGWALAALYAWLFGGLAWMLYTSALLDHKTAFYVLLLLAVVGGIGTARKWGYSPALLGGFAVFGAMLCLMAVWELFALGAVRGEMTAKREGKAPYQAHEHYLPGKPLPDIYHIVMDEFQADLFARVLDDKTRSRLAGFTWFPDASTPFGRTEMALSSMFWGIPYDYQEPPLDYIHRAFHSPDAMIGRLKTLGYRTAGYLHQDYPKNTVPPFDRFYYHRELAGAMSRREARELLASLWWFTYFPDRIAARFVPAHHRDQLAGQALLPDDAPLVSLKSFRTFLDREREADGIGGRYIFIHLILPHFPLVLGADCSHIEGRKTGPEEQAQCAIRLIDEFARMLREEGRFKDALILIHGDHGSQYVMKNGELRSAKDRFYGPEYSSARARPLMLVKASGIDEKTPFSQQEWAVDLFDIYPTVLEAVGEENVVLTGTSLLKQPAHERPRLYHFYDKDKSGKNRIVAGTMKRYRVERDAVVFEREVTVPLEPAGEGEGDSDEQ